ncbi:MAG: TonB-dependent receptor [Aquabacterium sp.]|uniref:TonB-dependent receptor n=1 Tax=Aquabacterium sp. TaxID=1872578 RepID=UPI003BD5A6BA
MKIYLTPIASAAILMCSTGLTSVHAQQAQDKLAPVMVTAPEEAVSSQSTLGSSKVSKAALKQRRMLSTDTASLLSEVPGVSSQGAGGVSSLPVVRGLADERLRIQVDGMDLMAACPNHMNPALSYAAPAQVGEVRVFAGVTPVSVGGDNIGGTVQVESAAPLFAQPGEGVLVKGEVGAFYRSNGRARGGDLSATVATEGWSLRYSGSSARSENVTAGGAFKPVSRGSESGPYLASNEVGSSAFESHNQKVELAHRRGEHLWQLAVSQQDIPYEGFPNQRMDMTANQSTHYNLRYSGEFAWGAARAQVWQQTTEHEMDMGPDRHFYGTGMPMNTWARARGASLQSDVFLSERDTLRLGAEYAHYLLYDWWPPVGVGSMSPNDFWNINGGRRQKVDLFAEVESQWTPRWMTVAGLRSSRVSSDTGPVQGYNGNPTYASDAAKFNAQDRSRTDQNWDVTVMARYIADASKTYEWGLSQKTRSPSLYQLYPWSVNAMAIGMNNFAGDGNGYVGNLALKPEVAHTASVSGDWHDVEESPSWGVKATAYVTEVRNYIDADRCVAPVCSYAANASSADYVMLQYANHDARLYGMDVSAHDRFLESTNWGAFTARTIINWVHGTNLDTGDGLYSVMPLHGKLVLEHQLNRWTSAIEIEGAASKKHVSDTRNELRTRGYGLLNLRTSYALGSVRIDAGVDNVFDRLYDQPIGGAYVGQGRTMMLGTVPWGVPVPGKGRSVNVGVRYSY